MTEDEPTAPVDDARTAELLEGYVSAFEGYDVDRIVELLTRDAVWEMPPYTGWYQGNDAIGRLIETNCPANGPGDMRLVPTSANGQPAFGVYMRDERGVHRAFQLQQLTLSEAGVSHVTVFFDLSLFASFGLPDVL
jgi:RNA polymerase sigma-70 factor (ECF subfamily)